MNTRAYAVTGSVAIALAATLALAQYSNPLALNSGQDSKDGNITVDFDNVKIGDVLSYLKKAGINYVVESGSVPQDKRFSIHLKSQPKDDAVEAIAGAIGMSVIKKGDIYTMRGDSWVSGKLPLMDGQWSEDLKNNKLFMSPERAKEFEKEWGPNSPKIKELLEQSKKIQDEWKEGSPKMKELMKELEKSQGEWKSIPKGKMFFKSIPDGAFKLKDMPELDKMLKDKDFMKLKELKDLKDMKLPEMSKFKVGLGNLGKFMDSLTPEQKAKMKSDGHLSKKDLTPEQMKMLGDFGAESKFEITFEKDGTKVTIKGD